MSYETAAQAAIPSIYSTFGVSATFVPLTGASVPNIVVVVDWVAEWQPAGTAQMAEKQITVSYKRSDINRKVKRGEKFEVGSTTYTVVAMSQYPDAWTEYEGKATVTES
jgi:hypothetical protein